MQEEDSCTYGRRILDGGLETVWQSLPTAQRTDNIGTPSWPNFDVETALDLT
jgi:hypothetical protein